MADGTVPELARSWGIQECTLAADRMAEAGWTYEESLSMDCPNGHAPLRVVRKPFERNGTALRYTALVCAGCGHAYEMRDLGYTSYPQLRKDAQAPAGNPRPDQPPTPARASRSGTEHKPTNEQQRVIDAARSQQNMVVQAGAGAGKTSTLVMVGHALVGKKVAYIAYNKAIAIEAKGRFPSQVRCSTSHALAGAYIKKYQRRVSNGQRQRAHEQARILNIGGSIELTSTVLLPRDLARIAMETVKRYCQSSDEEINGHHVPWQVGIDRVDEHTFLTDVVLPHARSAWADIRDVEGRLQFDHDYYFKMWALTKPALGFDVVMLDEAQDTNPALAAVIAAQDGQQILVGDSNQQLYAWRGAVDVLEGWDAPVRLTLRQSWRFGQAIADEANRWLSVLGADLRVIGNQSLDSAVGRLKRPDAVLCRTNAEAVKQVMQALQTGRHPALVGGGAAIKALAKAAHQLKTQGRTDHRELFAFRSWGELQDYVDNETGGRDLKPFVDLIDEHGVEKILHTVTGLADNEDDADVVISTAHKSKGREWNTVTIAEDYREPLPDDDGHPGPIPREDAMLAYVAVTRAKLRLDRTGLAWIDNYLPHRKAAAVKHQRVATTAVARPSAAYPAATRTTDSPTVYDALPAAKELADHLHRHAGPVVDRIESRDISGNTSGYTVLVCSHRTHPIVTVATTGLRFCTPAPDTEIVLTADSDQLALARALLDITAMTVLVKSYLLSPGHRMIDKTPLIGGTNIFGILAWHHPYFGAESNTVRDVSHQPLIQLTTLWPLVDDEVAYIRDFGHQALIDLWHRHQTPIHDLNRSSVLRHHEPGF
ncbi:UvrD-helicase domain-containing protein [Nocardia sp. NPDC049149]|uniref:UvrD-helicase domain-containing protein n=1 Tax=Nocardia sp. NPDC049149 TaxID=3364315 RepID=UPI00371FC703